MFGLFIIRCEYDSECTSQVRNGSQGDEKMIKRTCLALSLTMIVLVGAISVCNAVTYQSTQLTDDSLDKFFPKINEDGHIVWFGHNGSDGPDYWSVFVHDGSSIIQLPNSPYFNLTGDYYKLYDINATGEVVWEGEDTTSNAYRIYLYDGMTTTPITTNGTQQAYFHPRINDIGHIVWYGGNTGDTSSYEIFFYDGTSIIQITSDAYHDKEPQINDNDCMVWQGHDGSDWEIYLYDGMSIIPLTNNAYDDECPKISDNGHVVWQGYDGLDDELYLYDSTNTLQLTNNNYDDGLGAHQINDYGHVVWVGNDGTGIQTYLYDGTTTTQITNTTSNGDRPHINNNGDVVYGLYKDSEQQIYLYDGTTTTQVTNYPGLFNDSPQISDQGVVTWVQKDIHSTGQPHEIFMAEPILSATAGSKELTVTIPGAKCFSITIDNPGPNDITVSPSISWVQEAPVGVTFTGGSVSVSVGAAKTVNMPCFEVASDAQAGAYEFDIVWTGSDSMGNPVEITTDPILYLVNSSGHAPVGGQAIMPNKAALLLPWLSYAAIFLFGMWMACRLLMKKRENKNLLKR